MTYEELFKKHKDETCATVDPKFWALFSLLYKKETGSKPRMPLTCKEVADWFKKRNTTKFFYIPQVRQTTDYTCGPACASAIMAYYGKDIVETEIAEDAKTTKSDGTMPEQLVKIFTKNDLNAKIEILTTEKLRSYIDKQIPVIVDIQAWGDKKDYSKDYSSGHYVVAIGYDENGFFFMDPSQFPYGYLEENELESRWHDKSKKRKDQNLGIPVSGKKPEFSIEKTKKIK